MRLTKTPERVPRDARDAARAALRGDARERPHRRGASASACASIARRRAPALVDDPDDDDDGAERADPRDYDVDHYVRVLRETFAARLARAFTPEDFAAVFADPEQPFALPTVVGNDPYRSLHRAAEHATAHHEAHKGHEDHEEMQTGESGDQE